MVIDTFLSYFEVVLQGTSQSKPNNLKKSACELLKNKIWKDRKITEWSARRLHSIEEVLFCALTGG